ncbi:MAG: alpha/beta fold hydrolase [Burkholderiales bacterium]
MKSAVVVVHGLYLNAFCTRLWQNHLRDAGYDAYGFEYDSFKNSLSDSAEKLAEYVSNIKNEQIFCVGHSLGGLLIMQMLKELPDSRIRRLVLVGSPYQQSHVAGILSHSRVGRMIMGKAMLQWTLQGPVIPPPGVEVGVIAGKRPVGSGRLVAPGIPSPHDGTVAVAETAVPGMADRVVLPVTHTQMLFSRLVMRHMEYFLRNGFFERAA